jgi:type III secretion system low calcium response chaperone LcrH/SycD
MDLHQGSKRDFKSSFEELLNESSETDKILYEAINNLPKDQSLFETLGFAVNDPDLLGMQLELFPKAMEYYCLSPEFAGPLTKGQYIQARKAQHKIKSSIEQVLSKNITPAQAAGLDPKTIEAYFSYATGLYNGGEYEKALGFYENLNKLAPGDKRFLFGCAAASQMSQKYKQAIQYYTTISAFDATDPLPYYHMMDCCLHLNDIQTALLCINVTIELSQKKEGLDELVERCKYLKGYFTKELYKLEKERIKIKKEKKNQK